MHRKRTTTSTPPPSSPLLYGSVPLDSNGRASFAGQLWGVQHAPDRPYAIQQAIGPSGLPVHRFEVREGDYCTTPDDHNDRNRAEFCGLTKWAFGTAVWVSYAMRVKAGALIKAWNVTGQFHSTPDTALGDVGGSPPFATECRPGEKLVTLRRDTAEKVTTGGQLPTIMHSSALVRDRWLRVVERVVFDYSGNGAVRQWLDGTLVIDAAPIPIGFNDEVGPYWKFGIYRAAHMADGTLIPDPMIVEYANMEIGLSPLGQRVTAPLALPL